MSKRSTLILAAAFCLAPTVLIAEPADMDARFFLIEKHGLLLAQTQAPGRPLTSQEQAKPAPQTPVKDTVAPKAPPPPGTPNFPTRPANEPALKNPLDKK